MNKDIHDIDSTEASPDAIESINVENIKYQLMMLDSVQENGKPHTTATVADYFGVSEQIVKSNIDTFKKGTK